MRGLYAAARAGVLAGLIGVPLAAAADDPSPPRHQALQDRAWALEYQIPSLDSWDGATFSCTYQRHVRNSVRVGVVFSPEQLVERDMAPHRSYGIAAVFQRYTAANPVRGYVGIGPAAGVYRNSDRNSLVPGVWRTHDTWFAGLHALAGAEWLLHRGLSVFGEAQLHGYQKGGTFEERLLGSETIHRADFSHWEWLSRALVGVAAYF